jgi:hypothetical protein
LVAVADTEERLRQALNGTTGNITQTFQAPDEIVAIITVPEQDSRDVCWNLQRGSHLDVLGTDMGEVALGAADVFYTQQEAIALAQAYQTEAKQTG